MSEHGPYERSLGSTWWDPNAPHPRVRFEAISTAWAWFNAAPGTWIVASIAVLVANGVLHGAVETLAGSRLPRAGGGFHLTVPPSGRLVEFLLSSVVNGFFLGGMFRMACLQLRGRTIQVSDLFSVTDVLHELLIGTILVGLILFAATMAFVLPAFVAAGALMFVMPLIVDARLRATDAIRLSWDTLKGQLFQATVFHLLVNLLAGLGACLCVVGLVVTMPLYCLAVSVLYRDFFLTKPAPIQEKPLATDPDF
ncbi:MAG: hypothetical protein U0794_08425 [Isosphaeraceae bacterium]